jgi:hypothetical protein
VVFWHCGILPHHVFPLRGFGLRKDIAGNCTCK